MLAIEPENLKALMKKATALMEAEEWQDAYDVLTHKCPPSKQCIKFAVIPSSILVTEPLHYATFSRRYRGSQEEVSPDAEAPGRLPHAGSQSLPLMRCLDATFLHF